MEKNKRFALRRRAIEVLGCKCEKCGYNQWEALLIKDNKNKSWYKLYHDIISGKNNDFKLICANCREAEKYN